MKTKCQNGTTSLRGVVCAGGVMLATVTANVQAQYNYTTLNVPGATSSYAYGISGDNVVGWSYYSGGVVQSFVYNLDSESYTILPLIDGEYAPYAQGISGNNIVGYYNASGTSYGFLYNGSTYTTLIAPGGNFSIAEGIDGNNVVGYNAQYQGFVYNGSTYTTLSFPEMGGETFASGISGNNIVGYYEAAIGQLEGFLYNGSTYTTLSVPGSTGSTWALGIDGNNIAGTYGPSGYSQGFLYNVDNDTYTTLSVPESQYTEVTGISGDDIVGYYGYTFGGGPIYAFVATPVPEPTMLALAGLGGLSLLLFRRRR